jgi:hypothetical protein
MFVCFGGRGESSKSSIECYIINIPARFNHSKAAHHARQSTSLKVIQSSVPFQKVPFHTYLSIDFNCF